MERSLIDILFFFSFLTLFLLFSLFLSISISISIHLFSLSLLFFLSVCPDSLPLCVSCNLKIGFYWRTPDSGSHLVWGGFAAELSETGYPALVAAAEPPPTETTTAGIPTSRRGKARNLTFTGCKAKTTVINKGRKVCRKLHNCNKDKKKRANPIELILCKVWTEDIFLVLRDSFFSGFSSLIGRNNTG